MSHPFACTDNVSNSVMLSQWWSVRLCRLNGSYCISLMCHTLSHWHVTLRHWCHALSHWCVILCYTGVSYSVTLARYWFHVLSHWHVTPRHWCHALSHWCVMPCPPCMYALRLCCVSLLPDRLEREHHSAKAEGGDLRSQVEDMQKTKTNLEKKLRHTEEQLADVTSKV